MLFKNGKYYLRRESDPDRPAGDGTQCYAYTCKVADTTTEKAKENADTTTASAKAADSTTEKAKEKAGTTTAAAKTTTETTQAAGTTQAAVVTTETPGKCCDMLFSDPYFASCDYWGDPHWTSSFAGQGKFDNMMTGTFRNAVNKDGSFEQQQVQCPWNYKKTANTVIGVAVQIAGVKIVVTNKSVNVDDVRVPLENGAPPPSFSVDGVKISGHLHSGGLTVQSADCCYRSKILSVIKNKKGKRLWAYPHFFFNVDTRMPKDEPDARGICGKGHTYDTQVGSDDMIFTKNAMQEICADCSEEPWGKPVQCDPGFLEAHAPPAANKDNEPKEEDVSPEKMCASKVGLGDCKDDPLAQAKDICKSIADEDDKKSCIMDYCESDCDEDMADMAIDSSQHDPDAPDDDDDVPVSYDDDRL
jgi:hypothetical protein